MKRSSSRFPAIGRAALAVGLAVAANCSRPAETQPEHALRAISTDRINAIGRALAADDMAGRYYASPEADSAAATLLARLRQAGIPLVQRSENLLGSHPASFAHHFSVTLYRLGPRMRLAEARGANERAANLGADFVPLVFSQSTATSGRLVRLDSAAERAAFSVRNLTGAVVLVAAAADRRQDTALYARARRLQERGAAAVLFEGDARVLTTAAAIYPSHLSAEQRAAALSPRGQSANLSGDRVSLASQALSWRDADEHTIPALVVRSSWADRLQDGDLVHLEVDLRAEVSLGQNVLVGFRGKTRPNDVIVLGANYDHAGVNAAGDVLNGANDNVSGVAALAEVAAALASVRGELGCSVIVAFFSASRAGLQGSEMLLHDWRLLLGGEAHPVAMIGLRAIGRADGNSLLVVGGKQRGDFAAALERHDRREDLLGPVLALQRFEDEAADVSRIELAPSRGSDHLSFLRAGVPAVLLTGGMDAADLPNAADDWREVDADKIARVARLVFRTALDWTNDLHPAVVPASSPAR